MNATTDRARSVLPDATGMLPYQRSWLRPDLLAGLAVWAVVVPQGLAYGELAGLSPVAGLYTALGGMLLYAFVGSSRYANVGPESSIAIVSAAYVGGLVADDPERAAALAALLALVAAGFLLLGALLRLAVVARLLSTPVLAGYLTGSAIVIGSGQLGKLFAIPTPGQEWWRKLGELATNLSATNPRALLIGAATVLAVVALLRWAPRVPGILLVIGSATALVALAGWHGLVPVIGEVASGIPIPAIPRFAPSDVLDLLGAGASVALLVFAGSMLTVSALARRDREQVSGRREFLGLAAACAGSGLLQGFPANTSNARSFVAADSGARSQAANLVAAALTAGTLLVLTPVFRFLPEAALGAVVLVASARMIDVAGLRRLWHVRRSDFVLAAVTAGGVLVVGVLPGIGVGVAVSLLEVLRRSIVPPTAVLGRVAGQTVWRSTDNHDGAETVPGLLVYRFDAPLFFANAAVLGEEVLRLVDGADPPVREVVLDAEGVVDMDVTGAEALDQLLDSLEDRGVRLVLARVRTSLRETLHGLGLEGRLGPEHYHQRVRDAVADFARRTGADPSVAGEDAPRGDVDHPAMTRTPLDDQDAPPALPGALGAVRMEGELPRRADLGLIFDELDHQLATQAYLWALPLVSYAQWQQQHRDVFGASDYDLVHYASYRDRLGLITANATTPYLLGFVDLSRTGPLVIELPPGPTAGGLSDFWQREFAIIGEMGPDAGRGGRHLVVPPGTPPPDLHGTHVHQATGTNIMFGFRTLDPDAQRAQAIVDGVRLSPFDGRDAPATRVLSPGGRRWSGDQPRGLAYWARLHDVYQSETVDERDRFYLAMLKQLGIEKGREFAPDRRLAGILEQGAAAGELMAKANTFAKRFDGSRYWPDRQWDLPLVLSNSAQQGGNHDELLERASWFYEAVSFSAAMKSHTPGAGQAYLAAYTDAHEQWLDGGRDYILHIPGPVPAKLFWSATVYDVDTRCLIDNEQGRGDRGSRDADLRRGDDGSVDLSFGPVAPPGGTSNWVQTIPGQHWFSYFRLYGPLESYFDRSWKLGDITPVLG